MPGGQVAQLLDRGARVLERAVDELARRSARPPSARAPAAGRSAATTRRCWAPSCRSRPRRRRSASPASTMRAREARSASQPRAQLDLEPRRSRAPAPRRRRRRASARGPRSARASCTSAPTRRPWWVISVATGRAVRGRRTGARRGRRTARAPGARGDRERRDRRARRRAPARRRPRRAPSASRSISRATVAVRKKRLRASPTRNATGSAAKAAMKTSCAACWTPSRQVERLGGGRQRRRARAGPRPATSERREARGARRRARAHDGATSTTAASASAEHDAARVSAASARPSRDIDDERVVRAVGAARVAGRAPNSTAIDLRDGGDARSRRHDPARRRVLAGARTGSQQQVDEERRARGRPRAREQRYGSGASAITSPLSSTARPNAAISAPVALSGRAPRRVARRAPRSSSRRPPRAPARGDRRAGGGRRPASAPAARRRAQRRRAHAPERRARRADSSLLSAVAIAGEPMRPRLARGVGAASRTPALRRAPAKHRPARWDRWLRRLPTSRSETP